MAKPSPKLFAFVLMPFSTEFSDIYKFGIKAACEELGIYAERVDEQLFQESILERIYNQIEKADIVIADLSHRNPNVLYETGYAHALGKPVVLLAKSSDDLAFDLKHYPHVIYDGSVTQLKTNLKMRLQWFLENQVGQETQKNPALVQRYKDELPLAKEKALFLQLKEIISRFDNPDPLFDVFLSYSHSDHEQAKHLYDKITSSEIRVYFAPKDLVGGDDFGENIRQALMNSFEIWVLITPNSLKSEWVTTEWAAGWILKKRVVPILLRCNVDDLPSRLKSLHCVDYHEVDNLMTQLKDRINQRVGRLCSHGLTTHSTGAELACFSFARLNAARQFFPPG